MINYKTIIDGVFGDCRGVIYIEMIKKATKVCMDAQKIKDFENDLWKKLYEEFNEIFVGLSETDYSFNPNATDNNITHWYRVYEENGSQYADKIEIIDTGEILEKDTCINAAYDIMLKEIRENMTDCRFITDAINKMYDGLEHYNGIRYFYIIDEEHSVLISDATSLEKWNIKYKFEDNDSGDITVVKYINKKEN